MATVERLFLLCPLLGGSTINIGGSTVLEVKTRAIVWGRGGGGGMQGGSQLYML